MGFRACGIFGGEGKGEGGLIGCCWVLAGLVQGLWPGCLGLRRYVQPICIVFRRRV